MRTALVQSDLTDAALIAALSGPDAEWAAEQAFTALNQHGGSDELLVHLLDALHRQGVPGLALSMLAMLRGDAPTTPEWQALRDQLNAHATGAMPSAELRSRFESNTEGWSFACPPDLLDQYDVYQTPRGNIHVVSTKRDAPPRMVFRFADQRREVEQLPLGAVTEGMAFLLTGAPSPALLDRLLTLAAPSGYRPPIDILEPDERVAALWLHCVDLAHDLQRGRVSLFSGPEAREHYAQQRLRDLWRGEPTHVLTNHRPHVNLPAFDQAARQHVSARVQSRRQQLIDQQSRFYADCTPEHWRQRFTESCHGGTPPRVLACTTRYSTVIQYALRDLANAFRRRGCEFTLIKEPTDFAADVDTFTTLAARPFDLIIVINHLRVELGDRVHPHLPYICWIQDHLPQHWTDAAGQSITDLDLVLGQNKGAMVSLHGYPPRRFLSTSNLTDAGTYSCAPVSADKLQPYRCDVSYVSHGSEPAAQMIENIARPHGVAFRQNLHRIREALESRLQRSGWVSYFDRLDIILRAERETRDLQFTPTQRKHHIQPVVAALLDRVVRHEALAWVARWARDRGRTLHLYGRGWEHHPTLAAHARGVIENGEPLRRLCQASTVNLQITGYSALHQRLLDAVASGGVVLTRWNPKDVAVPLIIQAARHAREAGVGDMPALIEFVKRTPAMRQQLQRLADLGHPQYCAMDAAQRDRQRMLMTEVDDMPPDATTEDGIFKAFLTTQFFPHRSAADLPGYERLSFASEIALRRLLNRAMDDQPWCEASAATMRAAVLKHDTYASLVDKILTVLAGAAGVES